MCGRFAIYASPQACAENMPFEVHCAINTSEPHYNAAPSQHLPVLSHRPQSIPALSLMHWGLIPSWAKDRKISHSLINARLETAHEKPSFRHAFKKQRVLIPANGWYEWLRPEKQPYYHTLKNNQLLWFAGLWEEWRDKETGLQVLSFTLLTQQAYKPVATIHDRMPVIMSTKDAQHWLDATQTDSTALHALIAAQPHCDLAIYPVTKKMNKPQFEGHACIEALPE